MTAPTPGPVLLLPLSDAVLDQLAERIAERLPGRAPSAQPALLDRRGLAAALGVGLDTLDKLRGQGCPELRVGEAPRFELAAVLSWLRSRGHAGAGEGDQSDAR